MSYINTICKGARVTRFNLSTWVDINKAIHRSSVQCFVFYYVLYLYLVEWLPGTTQFVCHRRSNKFSRIKLCICQAIIERHAFNFWNDNFPFVPAMMYINNTSENRKMASSFVISAFFQNKKIRLVMKGTAFIYLTINGRCFTVFFFFL